MQRKSKKLTEYEIEALSGIINFSDGHARYALSQSLDHISQRIPELLSTTFDQNQVEANFTNVFFGMAEQRESIRSEHILYCPTASISIEIVANYLRLQGLSVSLIEPVFDNLADILKRHKVSLHPLREERLCNSGTQKWLQEVLTDAIFLVIPNNPTGYIFTESDFRQLVEYCCQEDKLLILDFSFRFFSPDMLRWSQYEILTQSSVRYIAIEDTGKTWSTFELKVSPLLADPETFRELLSIYFDIFICLSPINLVLVSDFIRDSLERGLYNTILNIPVTNRSLLIQAISNLPLRATALQNTSVEWIRIENEMECNEIERKLRAQGIHILPGKNFFWSQPDAGSKFIRIALMRDVNYFLSGVERMRKALTSITDSVI